MTKDKITLQIGKDFIQGDLKIKFTALVGGYGKWHPSLDVIISTKVGTIDPFYSITNRFSILCSPTGCGAAILYAIVGDLKSIDSILKEVFACYKESGVGSITTCYGASYYSQPNYKYLLSIGFKELVEYNNYRHSISGGYKQKLLQLSL